LEAFYPVTRDFDRPLELVDKDELSPTNRPSKSTWRTVGSSFASLLISRDRATS
jgi:hypothetical protein